MQHSSKFTDGIAIYSAEFIDKIKTLCFSSGHKQKSLLKYPVSFPFESLSPLPLATPTLRKNSIRSSAKSHPGIARMHRPNEDSCLHLVTVRPTASGDLQSVGLFLVADGMGGHSGGKYASTMVLERVRATIEADLKDPSINDAELGNRLVQAVQEANTQLFYENEKYGTFCGTTLTGAILIEQPGMMTQVTPVYKAYVVNVGDSRTYCHSRANGLSRVTRDHSVVEEMVVRGVISPEERYTHKERNKIYRCIGEKVTVEVDRFTLTLQQNDQLLLCSDGLWEMVRDDDLACFFASGICEPSMITPHLIQAALNRGGSDNVTAIVVMASHEAPFARTF